MKSGVPAWVLWSGRFAMALFCLAPCYWALNGVFQEPARLFQSPPAYFPTVPSLEHLRDVFRRPEFLRSVWNSVVVAGGATLAGVAVGALAACALARFRMRGRRAILVGVLCLTIFPQLMLVGPIRNLLSSAGLHNTPWGLILADLAIVVPFSIWVLTRFFESLPADLESAASIDGATPLQTFLHILLPLSYPGLLTTVLLVFIATWNEYLFALSFTVTDAARTAPVVIANFAGGTLHESPWGSILAASMLVSVPLIALVLLFQERIGSGISASATQG